MANIREVAKRAGVAIATVSAALNGTAPVSDEKKRRVAEAAAAVGYAPNAFARSLRLGKSRLIGVVVGDIANPFWGAMVRVVEKIAISAGYSIIVCNTDDREDRELAVLDQLRAQRVAGILLTPVGQGADYLQHLDQRDLPPLVTMDHKVRGLLRDFVGIDNRATARILTEYLLRLGHRRIAIISGRDGLWTADERVTGFVEAMGDAGIAVDPSLCVRTNYRGDSAVAATIPLLTRADRPTAIIGANNVIALGVVQAILDLGFRCPADISVAGIDDVPWSGLVRPLVTTAAQPIDEISGVAIEWLLEHISGTTSPATAREKIFLPKLQVGDSCADIRMAAGGPVRAGSIPVNPVAFA
jgi:LacI family transcriptional regulator